MPARHVTKVLPQALRTLQTSQMFANRWKYQRTLSADSQLFNGAADDLDTMQILTEHVVALRQWSCASRRTLAETYLLSPAEATQFIRDMISHERGPWSFIQQYDVVRTVAQRKRPPMDCGHV